MNRAWRAATLLLSTLSPPAIAFVPPPPSLPGQDDLAVRLVRAFDRKDLPAYAALLAENLHVFKDGRLIASDKSQWLARFGPQLTGEGVGFKLAPGFSASGRLLFIEYVIAVGGRGDEPPGDCCWTYDAVAYEVRDGRIVVIRRLSGGDTPLNARGERTQ